MHYTSWDRSNVAAPKLLNEDGPEVLAEFSSESAQVADETWRLEVTPALGASATDAEGRVYRLAGKLGRAKRFEASLDGSAYSFINEAGADWIIDNAQGEKVAQFSGRNSGVRKAILEFEDEQELSLADVAALSWFARLILDHRTQAAGLVIIATMALATIVAVLSLFVF